MVRFMDVRPQIGAAGPRVRRPDGSLDRACRRSFPTPQVSFYRMVGLSRLFPNSRRFNAYNLEYLPEDAVHPVDSVVGAYMQVRAEAIEGAGLLDENFFMYGEDLDWAWRIKDKGWEVWYNGGVEILHVKEAASSQSAKARIDFYEAMWLFYRKHYQGSTNWLLDKLIMLGIVGKGGLDVSRHLWRYCRRAQAGDRPQAEGRGAAGAQADTAATDTAATDTAATHTAASTEPEAGRYSLNATERL
jgi:GT2 family glycosyltransferase